MDCRKLLALLCGVAGCVGKGGPQVVAPPSTPAQIVEKARKDGDLPKTKPSAQSCLAAGVMFEAEADDPRSQPAHREMHRNQARIAYQQALDLDPNNPMPFRRLGALYVKIGDHERAVATYQAGLRKHPKEAPIWHDLGMAHARRKEWDPAATALKKAVECDPENRTYSHALGHCLARAGRVEESVACFRATVGEAQAHYNVARMMRHMKRDDLARQHLELALKAEPALDAAKQMLAQFDGNAPADADVVPAGFEEPAAR